MKIKRRIQIIGLFIIFCSGFVLIAINLLIENNYIPFKEAQANNIICSQTMNADEVATYLINNGFIVDTLPANQTSDNNQSFEQYCQNIYQEITIYDSGIPKYTATINTQIVNDILLIIRVLSFVFFLFMILLLTLFYLAIKNVLINPISQVENHIQNKKNQIIEPQQFNSFEIKSLVNSFNTMTNTINHERELQENLVVVLAHELKTPLARIKSITELAESGHPNYQNRAHNNQLIHNEIDIMIENLQKLLKIFNNFHFEISSVHINNLIHSIFNDDIVSDISGITVLIYENDQIIINTNLEKITLLLKNIHNNICIHSLPNTITTINIYSNKIVFDNLINSQNTSQNKLGNLINEFLSTKLQLKIQTEIKNNHYYTIIEFLDCK